MKLYKNNYGYTYPCEDLLKEIFQDVNNQNGQSQAGKEENSNGGYSNSNSGSSNRWKSSNNYINLTFEEFTPEPTE